MIDPWSAIAKAIVYPLARAIADAWFDARAKYDTSIEEVANETDAGRGDRFRGAVWVQHPPPTRNNTLKQDPPQGSGGV